MTLVHFDEAMILLMQFSLVISCCNITFLVFWISQGGVATLIKWGGWSHTIMCRKLRSKISWLLFYGPWCIFMPVHDQYFQTAVSFIQYYAVLLIFTCSYMGDYPFYRWRKWVITNFEGVLFWKMEINFWVKQRNFYHRCPIILNKNFVRGPCGGRQRDDLPGSPLEFPLIGENCAYIAEGYRRPCAATSGFWATICKTVRPMLSVRCPVCLSVLSVTLVYCGQTVGRIKMKLGVQVGLGPDHIVLGGDPADPPSKGHSPPPNFWPMFIAAKWLHGWSWYLAWR